MQVTGITIISKKLGISVNSGVYPRTISRSQQRPNHCSIVYFETSQPRDATCDFIGWSTLLHAALSAGGLVGPYWTISRTTKWETAAVPQWWWPTISLANDISLFCTWPDQLPHCRLKSYPHLTPPRLNTVPSPEWPSVVAKDSGTICGLGINYFEQHHR